MQRHTLTLGQRNITIQERTMMCCPLSIISNFSPLTSNDTEQAELVKVELLHLSRHRWGQVTDRHAVTKEFLSNTFGLKQTTDLQLYNRERRNDILREAKQYGASIRQLVRLTGISFAIVRDA